MTNWLHTFLYPPRCPGCGRPVKRHGTWCSLCFQSVWHPRIIDGSRRNHLDGCYALTDYRGCIRRVLQQIKYERKFQYEAACLYLLSRFPWMRDIQLDIAVPVPLSLIRLQKRGYNQSEFIFVPGRRHSPSGRTPCSVGGLLNPSGLCHVRKERKM